jgi:hypothetical protein
MNLKTIIVNRKGHPTPITINEDDRLPGDKIPGEKTETKKQRLEREKLESESLDNDADLGITDQNDEDARDL